MVAWRVQTEKAVQDGYDVRGFFFWVSTCLEQLDRLCHSKDQLLP